VIDDMNGQKPTFNKIDARL